LHFRLPVGIHIGIIKEVYALVISGMDQLICQLGIDLAPKGDPGA
jgi:hypothetical protein